MQCGTITRTAVSQSVVEVAMSKLQIKLIVDINIIIYCQKQSHL